MRTTTVPRHAIATHIQNIIVHDPEDSIPMQSFYISKFWQEAKKIKKGRENDAFCCFRHRLRTRSYSYNDSHTLNMENNWVSSFCGRKGAILELLHLSYCGSTRVRLFLTFKSGSCLISLHCYYTEQSHATTVVPYKLLQPNISYSLRGY